MAPPINRTTLFLTLIAIQKELSIGCRLWWPFVHQIKKAGVNSCPEIKLNNAIWPKSPLLKLLSAHKYAPPEEIKDYEFSLDVF